MVVDMVVASVLLSMGMMMLPPIMISLPFKLMLFVVADGWYLVVTRGSHRQFKHPAKPGRVTVAGKPSDDLPPGTLNSILKQAGLKREIA